MKHINDGWVSLNKRKTGGIGSMSPVWNLNRVRKIVSNFTNINEFRTQESELYEISSRSGWLEIFFLLNFM